MSIWFSEKGRKFYFVINFRSRDIMLNMIYPHQIQKMVLKFNRDVTCEITNKHLPNTE